jgi:hypothetical protein
MLIFSLNYSEILKRNNEQTRLAQNDFNEKIKQFTVSDLIETFVEQKKTGIERPSKYPMFLSMSQIILSHRHSFVDAIQFEELDNLKTSLHLTNSTNLPSSTTPDLSAGPPDELIIFDQPETGLPAFQAHFPVSSPTMSSAWPSTTNMKKSDSNRGKTFFN